MATLKKMGDTYTLTNALGYTMHPQDSLLLFCLSIKKFTAITSK